MKKLKILLLISFVFFASFLNAQPSSLTGEKRDQIESMKVAFLTRKLSLSTSEAQAFWPVYNEYQDEIEKLRDARRKEVRAVKDDFENIADKDVEKIVDGEIAFRQSELDILKKYHVQFKKTLPNKKVARLYTAEEDFKRELLKRIQERRDGRGKN